MEIFFGKAANKNRIFYHAQGQGILMREVDGSKLSDTRILYPHGQPDFDLFLDEDGTTHIVTQDNRGSVYYLKEQGNTFHKHLILQGKEERYEEKYFKLVPSGQFLNIFFLIKSKGKCLLSHQMVGNSVMPPQVVDYVLYGKAVYDVIADPYQNIHLVYLSEKGFLNYQMYRWSTKEWSEPQVLFEAEAAFPHIVLNDEKVCILFVDIKSNSAKYLELDGDITSIFTPFIPIKRPAMFFTPYGLSVQWQQDTNVYSITKSDKAVHVTPSRLQNSPQYQLVRTELRFAEQEDEFYGKSCYAQFGPKELLLFTGRVDLLSMPSIPQKIQSPRPATVKTPAQTPSAPQPEHTEAPQNNVEIQKIKLQLQTFNEEFKKIQYMQMRTMEQLKLYGETLETLRQSINPPTKRSNTRKLKQAVKKTSSQIANQSPQANDSTPELNSDD